MEALKLLDAGARPPLVAGQALLWRHDLPRARDREQAHALLRNVLADYLGCLPGAVPLRCEPGRAPYLEGRPDLSLSLSYADRLVILGCCPGKAHGIDLVRIAHLPDWRDVAETFFPPAIGLELASLAPRERDIGFALHWSTLEARSKCLGHDLQEYSPARDRLLNAKDIECATATDMPFGYCLALAMKDAPTTQKDQRN